MAKAVPDRTWTPRRLATALALLVGVSALVILVLALTPKATVVEVTVQASEAALTVVPQPEGVTVSLLHPGLEVRALQWTGAGGFEATPESAGRATARLPETGLVALRGGEPFRPALKLRCPTRLTLVPSRRDRLTITLDPAPCDPGWICEVLPQDDLDLRLRDVVLTAGDGAPLAAPIRLAGDGPAILFTGGAGTTELGLRPVFEPQGLVALRVIDAATGALSAADGDLAVALPEERMLLPAGERLVLLERQPIDPDAGLLLASGLTVRAPSFYRLAGASAESYLLGGSIRFLSGEKPPVALERGFLLGLPERQSFRLEALRMTDEGLELVLWGKPSRIELGPTIEFMPNLLPSCFLWLTTHYLGTLIVSTLVTLIGAFLALLRLLGLVKSQ